VPSSAPTRRHPIRAALATRKTPRRRQRPGVCIYTLDPSPSRAERALRAAAAASQQLASGMAKPLLMLPLLAAAFFLAAAASASAPVPAAAATTPAATRTANRSGGCYPRFFAFGDSLIDTGNFIHYSTAPGPVARSPYGETFFHRPTGRWSDGRLVVDFVGACLYLAMRFTTTAATLSRVGYIT
jgi:hypothetical protein